MKKIWGKLRTLEICVRPFHWVWPRIDRAIMGVLVYCGPVVVSWEAFYEPPQEDQDVSWYDYI